MHILHTTVHISSSKVRVIEELNIDKPKKNIGTKYIKRKFKLGFNWMDSRFNISICKRNHSLILLYFKRNA